MRILQSLALILTFLTACESTGGKHHPSQPITKGTFIPAPSIKPPSQAQLKTHLQDTTYVEGSFILFLRPNDARYAELNSASEELGDVDGDFGVGINNTLDSLKKNPDYKDIKGFVSINR